MSVSSIQSLGMTRSTVAGCGAPQATSGATVLRRQVDDVCIAGRTAEFSWAAFPRWVSGAPPFAPSVPRMPFVPMGASPALPNALLGPQRGAASSTTGASAQPVSSGRELKAAATAAIVGVVGGVVGAYAGGWAGFGLGMVLLQGAELGMFALVGPGMAVGAAVGATLGARTGWKLAR